MRALLESSHFDSVLATDIVGNSALHTAAVQGQADVVEALLSSLKFKRPGLANSQGQNPLHLAAMKGHAAVVGTLLGSHTFHDSAVNARTSNDGATALHVAVRFRQVSVVRLLLQSPRFLAIGNATIRDGHTALHLAATRGNIDIIKALLESNRFTAEAADSVDKSGRTAVQIMAEKHDHQAVQLLRDLIGLSGKTVRSSSSHKGASVFAVARHPLTDILEACEDVVDSEAPVG